MATPLLRLTFSTWLLIPILIPLRLTVSAEVYYQFSPSTGLMKVDGNPNEITPDEWQVWLFSDGQQIHAGSRPWGIISGKTADSVMKQLKSGQDQELQFNRFSGITEKQFTYFNPVGPIAILKKQATSESPAHQKAMKQLEALRSILNGLLRANELSKIPPGTALKEYTRNIVTAKRISASLQSRLETALDSTLPSLDDDFAELRKDLDAAQNILTGLGSPTQAADDLPDPFAPSKPKAPTDATSRPDLPDSPSDARSFANKTVLAIGKLCAVIVDNTKHIENIQNDLLKAEQALRQLERNESVALDNFSRRPIGGVDDCQDRTWTIALPWNSTSVVTVDSHHVSARDTDNASGRIVGVFNAKLETINFQEYGRIEPHEGNTWSMYIDGNGDHVEFLTQADAQEFKQLLECKLAARQVEPRMPTQQEIDDKKSQLDASIANKRDQVARLQATRKHLEDVSEEARNQIRAGLGFWRTAVTFEDNLILQQSDVRSARTEQEKIKSKLTDLSRDLRASSDASEIERLKQEEALWQELLKKSQAREAEARDRTRRAILTAREQKLTQYQRISGLLQNVKIPWLLDSMTYKPASYTDADFELGSDFNFGRLKGTSAEPDEQTKKQVSLFISRFRNSRPDIDLASATGSLLSEGDARQDELLLQTIPQATTPPARQQPKNNSVDDLPLP